MHLLALGRDEYWPIAHLGPADDRRLSLGDQLCTEISSLGDRSYTLLPRVSAEQFRRGQLEYNAPTSWVVAELLAMLLALAFARALWFSSVLSTSSTLVQFAANGTATRQAMILVATAMLTSIFLILLFPFVTGNGRWEILHGVGLQSILYFAFALMVLVSLADTWNYRWLARRSAAVAGAPPGSRGTSSRGHQRLQAMLLAVLAFGLSFALATMQRRGGVPRPRDGAPRDDTRTEPPFSGTAARPHVHTHWILLIVLASGAAWCLPRWATDSTTATWRHAMLRSIQLTSGVSPILPVLLLLAAALWWMLQVSAGYVNLDERRRPRLPMGVHRKRVAFVAETVAHDAHLCSKQVDHRQHAAQEDTFMVTELRSALRPERVLADDAYRVPFFVFLTTPIVLGVCEPLMTLERPPYGWVLWYLFLLPVMALISGTTYRLWIIWIKTRRLLTMLDSLPLRHGFEELKDFSWEPLWRLGTANSGAEAQRAAARVREAYDRARNTVPEVFGKALKPEQDAHRVRVWSDLERILDTESGWARKRELELSLLDQYSLIPEGNAFGAGCALDYLAQHWETEPETARRRRQREEQDELGTRACEHFVCLLYVSFLQVVLERMRTLMMAIGVMYILVLVAMTSYPFQPRATIVSVLAMLLFFIILVVTVVFAQVHRDATLSRITNTTPGKLGSDFWVRTTSFVALPLFTFLVSQFPQLNRFLYSWVEPALKALNK